MCKLLIMSGLNTKKKEDRELVWTFIAEMAQKMSVRNSDGIGYAAVDRKGNLFGEKWHNNYDFLDYRPVHGKDPLEKFKDFLDGSTKVNNYMKFGNLTSEISAITLHTRYATSGKQFENTHPFVDIERDTSLIHNGVINNVTLADNIRSTCDSERILNKYLEHEVMNNPADIQNMIDDLKGYFACGILSRDRDGVRILDVFKSRASLYAVKIREMNTLIFTTSDTDAEEVCKEQGLTIDLKVKVKEDKHLRLNAITGEPIFVNGYRDTANYTTTSYPSYNEYWQRDTKTEETKTTTTTPAVENKPVSEADWQKKTNQVVTNIEEARKVINKDLNEEEAALDGYKFVDGVWVRSNKIKQ